ncbi:uncharacterized protein LOC142340632 [Convolutriloba macropyga]|uniref:uncharacterized protein LOC142340632 n=1 Tax=Convolutriloba macropyga TaxID=536237 RepID=UPI003F527F6D
MKLSLKSFLKLFITALPFLVLMFNHNRDFKSHSRSSLLYLTKEFSKPILPEPLFRTVKFTYKTRNTDTSRSKQAPKISDQLRVHVLSTYHDTRYTLDSSSYLVAFLLIENCEKPKRIAQESNLPFRPELKSLKCVIGNGFDLKSEVSRLGAFFQFDYLGQDFCQIFMRCSIESKYSGADVSAYKLKFLNQTSIDSLPVTPMKRDWANRQSIGFCGSNWYHIKGQTVTDPQHLIEWFEHHRYLGVSKFHLRVFSDELSSLTSETLKIINFYQKSGLVDVLPGLPAPTVTKRPKTSNMTNLSSGQIWQRSQSLQLMVLNDCLYRNMFKYDWILISDPDEFIVTPVINQTFLTGHLRGFQKWLLKDTPNISFRERRFYTNCEISQQNLSFNHISASYLTKHRNFTKQFKIDAKRKKWRVSRGKSLISGVNCLRVSAHACERNLDYVAQQRNESIFTRSKRHLLHLEKFAIHHYRQVNGVRGGGERANQNQLRQFCSEINARSQQWKVNRNNLEGLMEIGNRVKVVKKLLRQ